MDNGLHTLARDGVLRVAINTGNRALVQQDGTALNGVSPALARRLAQEIGAKMVPVIYEGAGKVFADAGRGTWDVGFLAVDAVRAQKIAFTTPYVSIEATYAVRAASDLHDIDQVDKAGHAVLTSQGSAYDMYLSNTLTHARLTRLGTPPDSFAAFKQGPWDAVAGVRASLQGAFGQDPDIRILPGVLTAVHQAMTLPDKDDPRIAALNAFVDRALSDGFVAAQL